MLCNNNGKVEVLLERMSKWPSQSIFPINLPCQNCDLLDISKYYVRGNLLLMALLEDVCLFGMREMEALVRFPSLALVVHEEIGRVEWKGERYLKRRITITMHFLVRIESKSEGEFLMLIQLNPWASAASSYIFVWLWSRAKTCESIIGVNMEVAHAIMSTTLSRGDKY